MRGHCKAANIDCTCHVQSNQYWQLCIKAHWSMPQPSTLNIVSGSGASCALQLVKGTALWWQCIDYMFSRRHEQAKRCAEDVPATVSERLPLGIYEPTRWRHSCTLSAALQVIWTDSHVNKSKKQRHHELIRDVDGNKRIRRQHCIEDQTHDLIHSHHFQKVIQHFPPWPSSVSITIWTTLPRRQQSQCLPSEQEKW